MKLITKRNIDFGEIYPSNIFLSFGKINGHGWYIRIESPFSFVDYNFYDIRIDKYSPKECRKVFCLIKKYKPKFIQYYLYNHPTFKE